MMLCTCGWSTERGTHLSQCVCVCVCVCAIYIVCHNIVTVALTMCDLALSGIS